MSSVREITLCIYCYTCPLNICRAGACKYTKICKTFKAENGFSPSRLFRNGKYVGENDNRIWSDVKKNCESKGEYLHDTTVQIGGRKYTFDADGWLIE